MIVFKKESYELIFFRAFCFLFSSLLTAPLHLKKGPKLVTLKYPESLRMEEALDDCRGDLP